MDLYECGWIYMSVDGSICAAVSMYTRVAGHFSQMSPNYRALLRKMYVCGWICMYVQLDACTHVLQVIFRKEPRITGLFCGKCMTVDGSVCMCSCMHVHM